MSLLCALTAFSQEEASDASGAPSLTVFKGSEMYTNAGAHLNNEARF